MADVTKYGTATGSALTGDNWDRIATAAGAAESIGTTIAALATENDYLVVTNAEFGGTFPGTGTYTVVLEISSGNASVSGNVRFQRYNSSNALQQSSSYAGTQVLSSAQEYTFSVASVDLGTWSAGDYLAAHVEFISDKAHGNASVTVEMDVAANVETRITYPEAVAAGGVVPSARQRSIRTHPVYRR